MFFVSLKRCTDVKDYTCGLNFLSQFIHFVWITLVVNFFYIMRIKIVPLQSGFKNKMSKHVDYMAQVLETLNTK